MNYQFISITKTLRPFAITLIMLAFACMFDSCSVIRTLKVDAPTADCAGSGQHYCHDTLIRASAWHGRKGKIDINCGCDHGISRFKVTTKPMDIVLGFITVGFVVKQRIEWDCAQRSGSSKIPR